MCGVVAERATVAGGVGLMLKRQMHAPETSRKPWRMTAPALLMAEKIKLVNTTLQPASQNLPMLIRLLTNEGMTWQSLVPGGRFGRRSLAVPMDEMWPPLAMLTVVGGVL